LSGRRFLSSLALAAAALALPGGVAAQAVPEAADRLTQDASSSVPQATSHETDAPRVRAVRAPEPIRLDGDLSEEAWASAPALTEFRQTQPNEGLPLSEPTEVRFLYDSDALYVGALLFDDGPIYARLKRRDASFADTDLFAVFIDGYHDHTRAFRLAVNPAGVRKDSYTNPDGSNGDGSWDPVWEAATRITNDGWVAEMRIPFSQLRFSPADEQVWGIQVERKIRHTQEWGYFAFTPLLEAGGIARYGHLEGIQGVQPGHRLEMLPYVTGRLERVRPGTSSSAGFADPFRSGSNWAGGAGVDLKYRLGPNVTLDATVNPDFGQVEVDPAVINLTAFETRYEERRPFFVEGSDLFQFQDGGTGGSTGSPPQLVYSRRIGRAPQGSLPTTAAFSEVPSATTIVGAGKLTGRTDGGWAFAALGALTQQEAADWVDGTGSASSVIVEPATAYGVGRLKREAASGSTRIGGLATAVKRDLSDASLEAVLPSAAYTGGLDFTHEWSERTWRFSAAAAASHVQGSPEAMVRTQTSSSRYLQRPDVGYLGVDSAATSVSGYYGMADLNKQAGSWQVKLAGAVISPGFEVNDVGFQSRADRIILDTQLRYQQTVPGRVFRSWNVRGGPDAIWNFGGDRVYNEINVLSDWTLLNFWEGVTQLRYDPEAVDDRLTRGGPLATLPARYSGRFGVTTDRSRPVVLTTSYDWARDAAGAWSHTLDLNVLVAAQSNWEVSIGPRISREHVAAQYVSSVADPAAVSTFGRRYVFAGLDQTTVSLDARLNVTFTPDLTLEIFAQPFISSGDYGAPEEFKEPNEFDFLRYGRDVGTVQVETDGGYLVDPDGGGPAPEFSVPNRDFNYLSLLGNAVLRWEWRPGSTLYLVWQQTRARETTAEVGGLDGLGDFRLGRDAGEIFRTPPDNIFQIKVSYWLNP
jgi:hypothetical protein